MEWMWNAVMAWIGWNFLAPLLAFVVVMLLAVLFGSIMAAIDWQREKRRKASDQ